MSVDLKQNLSQRLENKLVMTVQLRQAIKLLQLNRTELIQEIKDELEKNPLLDEKEFQERSAAEQKEAGDKQEQDALTEQAKPNEALDEVPQPGETKMDEFDWEHYFQEQGSNSKSDYVNEFKSNMDREDLPGYEQTLAGITSLSDHLQWQLSGMELRDELEKMVSEEIIFSLNEDGYLQSKTDGEGRLLKSGREGAELIIKEIAEQLDVEIDYVEDVLCLIQELDPPGIGARDLKECLLIQVKLLDLEDKVVTKIIEGHLEDLESGKIKKIEKELGITTDEIRSAVEIIRGLDPKPGRRFSSEKTHYISPDIYVEKTKEGYRIRMNDEGLPLLKINSFYKRKVLGGTKEEKKYVEEQLNAAKNLIKSIHQRQRTIYKVTESIVKKQGDFFESGKHYLKPMILKDVAQDIGMHESTVSRVTTNKYVHTPQGLFELKFFFNASLGTSSGEGVASQSVKEKIKEIIASEEDLKPLSDQRIADILKGMNGIKVARRTVAKYREALKIPSASRRKKRF